MIIKKKTNKKKLRIVLLLAVLLLHILSSLLILIKNIYDFSLVNQLDYVANISQINFYLIIASIIIYKKNFKHVLDSRLKQNKNNKYIFLFCFNLIVLAHIYFSFIFVNIVDISWVIKSITISINLFLFLISLIFNLLFLIVYFIDFNKEVNRYKLIISILMFSESVNYKIKKYSKIIFNFDLFFNFVLLIIQKQVSTFRVVNQFFKQNLIIKKLENVPPAI